MERLLLLFGRYQVLHLFANVRIELSQIFVLDLAQYLEVLSHLTTPSIVCTWLAPPRRTENENVTFASPQIMSLFQWSIRRDNEAEKDLKPASKFTAPRTTSALLHVHSLGCVPHQITAYMFARDSPPFLRGNNRAVVRKNAQNPDEITCSFRTNGVSVKAHACASYFTLHETRRRKSRLI